MKMVGLFVICVMAALIAGCGSSSSSGGGGGGGKTVNGIFADAPVVGLSFSCGGQSGVTGAGGTYTCPAGSTVTFTVGGITICTAPAQAVMTPISCAQANGNASANASTPSVVAIAQFLISIGTPNGTTPGTLSTLTITSAELQAAASLNLNFSTATQGQLQTAVTAINPGQTLASPATAQNELSSTVTTNVAGSYSGSYGGADTGTWTLTIDSAGNVSGTYTSSQNGPGPLSGNLVNGTTFSGTAGGNATWTGTVDTSKSHTTGTGAYLFTGTWNNTSNGGSGTFTN